MIDPAHTRSLECSTCGAVWITASPLAGVDGSDGSSDGSSDGASDGSHACLQCGGVLLPAEVTEDDPQEIGS
jgi:hypothetical protein